MKRIGPASCLALLVGVAGCVGEQTGTCVAGNLYSNDVFGVSFCHPRNWEQIAGAEGSLVAVLSPASSDGDLFRENVNLIAEEVGAGITASDYARYSVANAPKFIDDFELVSNGTRLVGGLPGYFLEYRGTVEGRALHWDVVIGVRQGVAFSLTFSAEPAARHAYAGDWKFVADSFAYI